MYPFLTINNSATNNCRIIKELVFLLLLKDQKFLRSMALCISYTILLLSVKRAYIIIYIYIYIYIYIIYT